MDTRSDPQYLRDRAQTVARVLRSMEREADAAGRTLLAQGLGAAANALLGGIGAEEDLGWYQDCVELDLGVDAPESLIVDHNHGGSNGTNPEKD